MELTLTSECGVCIYVLFLSKCAIMLPNESGTKFSGSKVRRKGCSLLQGAYINIPKPLYQLRHSHGYSGQELIYGAFSKLDIKSHMGIKSTRLKSPQSNRRIQIKKTIDRYLG